MAVYKTTLLLLLAFLACYIPHVIATATGSAQNDTLQLDTAGPCSEGLNGVCVNYLISKALGTAIIAGAFFLKVPQILNMVKAKTSDGVILSSLYLEIASYGAMASYNLLIKTPLTTYAESLVVTVQNLIIVFMCWQYQKINMTHRFTFVASGVVFLASMLILPEHTWPMIMVLSTLLAISSRSSQIIVNFRQGNTGVLSLTTTLLQCAGNAARVFTTLQEVDDITILASFLISLALNLTVLFQILFYWNAKKPSSTDTLGTSTSKKLD